MITYSALNSTMEKGKQPKQALEIFKEMQQHGPVPDVITFNALISALAKSNQPEQALEILVGSARRRWVVLSLYCSIATLDNCFDSV